MNNEKSLTKRAEALLRIWCDGLDEYRVSCKSERMRGALLCPACQINHGRLSDLVLPLVTLWHLTGEEKYLTDATEAVAFNERTLKSPDGGYYNDAGNRWLGTTAFSALALGETLLAYKRELPCELYDSWLGIFNRLCAFVYDRFPTLGAVINYKAGEAALMAMSFRLTGNNAHMRRALICEKLCSKHFDSDGLFFGEGHPSGYVSEGGCHLIDMGYNLEESLPLLLRYSELMGSDTQKDFYKARLIDHLEFMLPDGAIDNSFGTRHNKWTYWGSRTSDGVISALAMCPGDAMLYEATKRALTLWERCTEGGLLALPMGKLVGEPTCLHHTICHAKALALLIISDPKKPEGDARLPREKEYGVKSFQGGRLALISRGDYRATVNAIDLCNYKGAENGGGTLTMLWHEAVGAIFASTTDEYFPSEPLNMQYAVSRELLTSMTVRALTDRRSSVKDKDVTLRTEGDGVYAENSERELYYGVEGKDFVIKLKTKKPCGFYLPTVCGAQDVRTECNRVMIGESLEIIADIKPTVDTEKKHFHPVGGFLYTEIFYRVDSDIEIRVRVNE